MGGGGRRPQWPFVPRRKAGGKEAAWQPNTTPLFSPSARRFRTQVGARGLPLRQLGGRGRRGEPCGPGSLPRAVCPPGGRTQARREHRVHPAGAAGRVWPRRTPGAPPAEKRSQEHAGPRGWRAALASAHAHAVGRINLAGPSPQRDQRAGSWALCLLGGQSPHCRAAGGSLGAEPNWLPTDNGRAVSGGSRGDTPAPQSPWPAIPSLATPVPRQLLARGAGEAAGCQGPGAGCRTGRAGWVGCVGQSRGEGGCSP